ncbi:MAG: methanogenesis marker 9 domain-containing protein [Methanobacteriaceae archaeon]
MSWDDAPSHVCRGGDKRALSFCCPPVKPCPVLHTLESIGLSPQDYMDIKDDFAKKTQLGEGVGTCFGSLVWCCKPSKPCPLRDMTLRNIGMSVEEYLSLKKELAEALVGGDENFGQENIKALVETFNISEDEALNILNDCDNDLRMSMKLLRMKSLDSLE